MTRGSRTATLAHTLALTLLFTACGDDTPESREAARRMEPDTGATERGALAPDGAPMAPGCTLLAEERVEEALGFDVVMNDNSTGNCLVTPADGSPSAPAVDFRIEDRVAAYDYFAAQPDAEPIEGLGDRAVWSTLNEMTGNLAVVLGDSAVVVAIARADGLDARARRQAEALARAIVSARQ